MNKKMTTFLGAASVLALGLSVNAPDANAGKEGFEKCYGIAKTAKNDCASADGAHSCAAQATKDGDVNEWVYLPEGTCDKIVGGKPAPEGEDLSKDHNDNH